MYTCHVIGCGDAGFFLFCRKIRRNCRKPKQATPSDTGIPNHLKRDEMVECA